MERAIFEDKVRPKGSSGETHITYGQFPVRCDLIPDDALQDWSMGPKQIPGQFGVYREHLYYPSGHGPYAFAVAKTPEDAKAIVTGSFKRQVSAWEVV